MIKYTIKTAYSEEVYYCFGDIETFLQEICFCDDYEVIKEESAETEMAAKYNKAIEKVSEKTEVNQFWENNALLYVKGWYGSIDEMIQNNFY